MDVLLLLDSRFSIRNSMLLQHFQTYVMFCLILVSSRATERGLLSGFQFTNVSYNKCGLAVQKGLSFFTHVAETWL